MFDFSSQAFDANAIARWNQKLLQVKDNETRWCVFSIPDSSVAITADAATLLRATFPQLREQGCELIAFLCESVPAKIIAHSLQTSEAQDFFVVSHSIEDLCKTIEMRMGDKQILNNL